MKIELKNFTSQSVERRTTTLGIVYGAIEVIKALEGLNGFELIEGNFLYEFP